MGKTSTLVINQPDIARYAKKPSATIWSQLFALPIANTVGATLGIYGTSAIYNAWGTLDWNPWILEHDILTHHWGPGARAAIFFVSAFFIFAGCIGDMGANIIPFGADFMTLFPRFLNIRRGMWVGYLLGVCINPWHILASATGFLTFLGGYSIFLGPFLGIFITDYFIIRKGNVYVEDLYRAGGKYWYTGGINWRPAIAWVIPVAFVVSAAFPLLMKLVKCLLTRHLASRIRDQLRQQACRILWVEAPLQLWLVFFLHRLECHILRAFACW